MEIKQLTWHSTGSLTLPVTSPFGSTGKDTMPQFSIRLPDKVLQADMIASVRAFAERTDWTGLPSSTHLHAGVISVVLRPPDTDTSIAEEGLLLLAAQRIIVYLESPIRSRSVDLHLWLAWIERIEKVTTTYKDEESDANRLFKDKMKLSIELFEKAKSLLHSDNLAFEVLYASACEIGESANIQTANDSRERIKSALEVAKIAKLYSFDEHSITHKPSIRKQPMNVLKSIKAFFTAPEPDPIATANRNLFSAASDAFDAAYAHGETHTTRANHRYNIFMAARSPHDADAYNEEIARYTDPADFDPYTAVDLDAHTAMIESLTIALDKLTAAFTAFSRTDHLYKPVAAVYKGTTALYVFATDAYSRAAHLAMTTALEGNVQAAKDNIEVMLLEIGAANAEPTDTPDANAKATAYKANATKNAATAKRLEQKATEAQARAEALCAKASSAADNAEEALEDAH